MALKPPFDKSDRRTLFLSSSRSNPVKIHQRPFLPVNQKNQKPNPKIPARAWAVIVGGFAALFCAAGIWHGFGVFFKPLLAEFGVDRTDLSLVTSVAVVTIALCQIIIGQIIKRTGAAQTITLGISLMGVGLILTGFANSPTIVYLTFSTIMAAGYGLASLVSVGNVIAQWFSRRRGMAMGIAFSGFSAGALVFTPLAQFLILQFSWRAAFWIIGTAFLVVVIPILLLLIRNHDSNEEHQNKRSSDVCSKDTTSHIPPKNALRMRTFWLLSGTYFACGFTDFLLFFHFPLFAIGLGIPDQTAANILGVAGGISIAGTIVMAWLSDRWNRALFLFLSYSIRAIGFLILMFSEGPVSLYIFMVVYGFVMFSSNPITSATTRELYGPKSFGTLYGYLIFFHYVGSFFGPITGGIVYDRFGRYDKAFLIGAILLSVASIFSLLLGRRNQNEMETKSVPVESKPST